MFPVAVRQVGILYDGRRHHQSPSPQFKYVTGKEGNILQSPVLVVSASTTHKTFGPTDLTSTSSVCTRGYWWHGASNPGLPVWSPIL
ncbi:hypothetical protein TNCV_1877491 [Trichonephila clavipes]|nr:hypothetical protein TNCV_1877491 [Trichonephila clavipes]